MTNTILVFCVAGWFACGYLACGLNFAFFQRKFPEFAEQEYERDKARARLLIPLGLAGLLVSLVCLSTQGWFRYGLKFK